MDNLLDPKTPGPITPSRLVTLEANVVLPPLGNIYSRRRWAEFSTWKTILSDEFKKGTVCYIKNFRDRIMLTPTIKVAMLSSFVTNYTCQSNQIISQWRRTYLEGPPSRHRSSLRKRSSLKDSYTQSLILTYPPSEDENENWFRIDKGDITTGVRPRRRLNWVFV